MSERDELRERLGRWLFEHDGEGGTRSWEAIGSGAQEAMRSGADAILQEIERTHVLVPRGLARRLAVAAAASDCFEEDGAPCIRGDDWVKIDALKGV